MISIAIALAPAALSQSLRDVTIPSTVYSDTPFSVTVTSYQSLSSGTLTFSLSSNCQGCIVSPTTAQYSGTSQTYTVTVTGLRKNNVQFFAQYGSGSTVSTRFEFIDATATRLNVDAPATAAANAPFNVTITAVDDMGRLAYGFNNQVTVTSTDPARTALGSVTLTNGRGSLSTTLPTQGTWTITAALPELTSGTDTIQITAGAATRFEVIAPPTVNAGDKFSITVNARDASGNLVPGYSGPVTLTSTGPQSSSIGTVNLSGGTGTLTEAVLKAAGSRTITGTAAGITGTSGTVIVTPGQAIVLGISAPATIAAGSSFSVQVTAQDFYGNTVTTYGPTVTLSSTDTQASGMGNVTLTNGTGSFQTTHQTAGDHTITASGAGAPPITGFANIAITAAAATHFEVNAPPEATTGVPFNFTIIARDAFGNLAPTYSGTVEFTSTDSQAVLPANAMLSNGLGAFQATLKTAGNQQITARDTTNTSITGASDEIAVMAGTLSRFVVEAPASTASGSSFDVAIKAKDANFNTVASYAGPATITSSDTQAVIPASVTFTNGVASFRATLKSAAAQTLTAADQAISGFALINVQAAAATTIEISPVPAAATAGQQFSFTVTAKDQFGNISPGYTGILRFSSGDTAFVPPPNGALSNGTGTFNATLKTAGSWTITATDTSNASITGTSAAIVVAPSAFHHFLIDPIPTQVVAGEPFNFTVTAKDEFNNTVTGYAGTVAITSTDSPAALPGDLTFSGGVAAGQASLKSAGNQTLTVTTSTMPPVSEAASILVKPGPPYSIERLSGDGQTATIRAEFGEPLVVRIRDFSQNPIPNWQVEFHAASTGPSTVFSPNPTVLTGSNGEASVNATANEVAGSYSVRVTASSLPERLRGDVATLFDLTNRAGPPADVQATGGAFQVAQVGTQFPMPLVVTVKDSFGNPLSNVDVTLEVPASGASAALAPTGPYRTDSSGNVTVTATANATTGSFSVTASVAGAGSASLLLTNLAAPPGSLTITRGSGQSATVNSNFNLPLEVLVRDASGTPVPNAGVVFTAAGSGAAAALSAYTLRTDASGLASVTATANATAGGYQVTVVAVTGGTGIFNLTNTPGAPANIEAVEGALQSTPVNSHFSNPLRVRVIDQSRNGISGATVTFEPPATGASAVLTSPSASTDQQGYAEVTAIANTQAGTYFLNARVAGVPSPATFSLENLQDPTSSITVSGGSQQSVVVATQFPQLLQVTVRDGQNRPIPNVGVIFTPPATGPSAVLSASTAVTDAQGQASVRATANTVAGAYLVEAAAPGVSASIAATFSLTNRAGPVSTITTHPDATPQSTRINIAFPRRLRIRVADSHGNPVAGATVTYTSPSSGASAQLSGTTNITDSTGHSAVTAAANAIAGSYAVTASVEGEDATFSLTNTPGPPAAVEIVSGNAQVVSVGSAFAPLVVTVRDSAGNRLAGQSLTFSSPRSGASAVATTTSASTDSSGQASFSVTPNTVAGSYEATISGTGIATPAVFELTNRAASASRLLPITGTPQLAFAGSPFGIPLRVIVQDAYGNPVSGVTVNFSAPASAATARLSSPSDVTNPDGQASVNAIAGEAAGTYVVTASVAGVGGLVPFSLTNVPVYAGFVSATSDATQSARVSTTFVLPLTAVVRDARGNPVAGVSVTFAPPDAGPSVSLSERTKTTDVQGIVSVNAVANQSTGSYQVVATAAGFGGTAVFNLVNTTIQPGQGAIHSIVNAASFTPGAAPGSLQTIFGTNLASDTATVTQTPLPAIFGGVSVTIAGRQLPLLYVSPSQINFQLPPGVTPGRFEVIVSQGGTTRASAPLIVNTAAPGIFLQIGRDPTRAAAANADYSLNLPSRPAPAGGYVLMFLTGIGEVAPPIPAGEPAPLSPLSLSRLLVSATIGPRPVSVQFAGKAPGSLGDQVNLQIPLDLPPGEYPVIVRVNGVLSNAAIISVGAPSQ